MNLIINEANIIGNDKSEPDIIAKEQEYMDYIQEHIGNVLDAYNRIFKPLLSNSDLLANITTISVEDLLSAISDLENTIQDHDQSKYSDQEFYPYRNHFHPTSKEKARMDTDEEYAKLVDDKYQEAWKHHYTNNSHHPQFWGKEDDNGTIVAEKDMDLISIIEMLCDWEAMSTKFGTSTKDWYANDAQDEQKAMTVRTKSILDDLMANLPIS